MNPIEVKKDIYWVGAIDWNCRNFHGYALSPSGTTYNSFLIKDEKTVLVDSVKSDFFEYLMCNVAQLVDPESVDYLVVNHIEPDHAGCLDKVIEMTKPEKIFVSPMAGKNLSTFFDTTGWPLEVIKSGQEVSIGKRTLKFFETRMIHWPDNMFTYIPEEKLLVSSDAFGQNLASSERFVDEVCKEKVGQLLSDYYANIVLPYSPQVIKTLESLGELGLDIETLCPDHGLIYRTKEDVQWAVEKYMEFATQKQKKKAVIIYDTMWHSTEKMANAIGAGISSKGVSVKIMAKKANHHSVIMNEIIDTAAIVLGSPTHNNGILAGMADVMTYIKGLRPANKIGASFGSFGWSGECIKILNSWLEDMKVEVIDPGVKVKNKPNHDAFKECFELGQKIGQAVLDKVDG